MNTNHVIIMNVNLVIIINISFVIVYRLSLYLIKISLHAIENKIGFNLLNVFANRNPRNYTFSVGNIHVPQQRTGEHTSRPPST